MKRTLWALLVLALYLAHQDFWFWNDARPPVFGILPIGLFYHVSYALVSALVLLGLVVCCWPAHLDNGTTPE